jgi:tetratricopeptide (TPR) repeat protein
LVSLLFHRRLAIAIAAAALRMALPAEAAEEKNAPPIGELASRVDQVSVQLRNAEDQLRVVETQYTQRPPPSTDEARRQRFSEGEIQYLLGNFSGASVLFYDLVEDAQFKRNPQFQDALFYLAEGLYQQRNYLSARLYYRQLMALSTPHYRQVLGRLLEIASRLNDFSDIEGFIAQARQLGGELPEELQYLYGKSLLKRRDLSQEDRLQRLSAALAPLAGDPKSKLRLQSAYFLAVVEVQRGSYPAAIEKFSAITQSPTQQPSDGAVKELASLSVGRLLYEIGQYDAAIDRYQEVPRESTSFAESLYEIAWCNVKKEEFGKAKDATDILLLVDPDSTLAPEAQILQGQLLVKMGRFADATQAYDRIVHTYAPVRDEIEALLTKNSDPVVYFDNLLAKNEKHLDVASLLPPLALKWANTQREVSQAMQILNDLDSGRHGVSDSRTLANRLLSTIDERGLTLFPSLQEGYARADAVDSALLSGDRALISVEGLLIRDALSVDQRQQLEMLRAEEPDLQKRFAALPTTSDEVESRRQRILARLDAKDKEAFKLGLEVQGMVASIAAMKKWIHDTRSEWTNTPEQEKEFLAQMQQELGDLNLMQEQLAKVQRTIVESRGSVDVEGPGEGGIRAEYRAHLEREHQLLASAEPKLAPEGARLVERIHQTRVKLEEFRRRVDNAKKILQEQVLVRGREIRDKVSGEQQLLSGYDGEVSNASRDAQNLVGRIAFDSFKRVHRQFYNLIQKADVGLVDIAFTRKQKKTSEIQQLATQKDQELRMLEKDFKEILQDAN